MQNHACTNQHPQRPSRAYQAQSDTENWEFIAAMVSARKIGSAES